MQTFRTALKESAWVFLISRITMLLVSYVAVVLIPQFSTGHPLACTHEIWNNPCTYFWLRWDATAYVRIAHQGYASTSDVAFFPLWPLMIHYGGLLLGAQYWFSYYIAGLLISNICFFFTLVLLYILLAEDFESSLAKRVLFYITYYPYALFFFLGYAESLFMLLCLAVFLLLRRGKALSWPMRSTWVMQRGILYFSRRLRCATGAATLHQSGIHLSLLYKKLSITLSSHSLFCRTLWI